MASGNKSPALWAGALPGEDARINYAEWVTFVHRHDLLIGSDPITNATAVAGTEIVYSNSPVGVHPITVGDPTIRRIRVGGRWNSTDGAIGAHIERLIELRVGYYRADSAQVLTVKLRKYDSSAGTVSDVLSYTSAGSDFATTGSYAVETKTWSSPTPLATIDNDDLYWWEVSMQADTAVGNVYVREFSFDVQKRAVE